MVSHALNKIPTDVGISQNIMGLLSIGIWHLCTICRMVLATHSSIMYLINRNSPTVSCVRTSMVNVLYPWKHPKAKVLKIDELVMNHKIKSLSSFSFVFLIKSLAKDRVSHKLVTVRDTHLNRIHKFCREYLLFLLILSDFVNRGHSVFGYSTTLLIQSGAAQDERN